jgi:glutamate/aspartate transport system permease protein
VNLDFSFFTSEVITNFIIKGFYFSIALTLTSFIGGMVLGTILALMNLSSKKWLRIPASSYITLMRSVPLVMVILWFYLLIPMLLKKPIGAEMSAFITFTLFQAAYYSEIMRAGIQSISKNQVNAGYALGLTYGQCMRYIVLPQAFRNMLPVFMTQTIILFQDTSLVYAIGAYDMLKGFEIAGKNFNRPVETYLIAAVVYFIICFSFSRMARVLQRRVQIIR